MVQEKNTARKQTPFSYYFSIISQRRMSNLVSRADKKTDKMVCPTTKKAGGQAACPHAFARPPSSRLVV